MSDFFDGLVRPTKFCRAGIEEAVLRSRRRLFGGGMSRLTFITTAFQIGRLRSLPLAHLLDHRVRGPIVSRLPDVDAQAISAGEWRSSVAGLERWFGILLQADDRRGARELTAASLRVDPRDDAVLLARLGALDLGFLRACIRGRLGNAIKMANGIRLASDREAALSLVARLLVYFGCFSVQLVAARAWWIDHLPFRQEGGPGRYRTAALLKDVIAFASSIDEIGTYMAGERPRYPSRTLVSARRPQAADWRSEMDASDETMREDLVAFFQAVSPTVQQVRRTAARVKAVATDNQTVHKLVYGITAGEALSFGVDRLLQLRAHAEEIVRGKAEKAAWEPLPIDPRDFPAVEDQDAANLLYVLRLVTLDDRAAAPGADTRLRKMSIDPDASLTDVVDARFAEGELPGTALRKEARRLLRGRTAGVGGSARRRVLALRQHYDVCPAFWLQIERVKPLPEILRLGADDLLEAKRRRDDEDTKGRPPNVRLASGRDPSRGRRRPSR